MRRTFAVLAALLALSFSASASVELDEENAMPDLNIALQVVGMTLAQAGAKPHRICGDAPGSAATLILLHGKQKGGGDVGIELHKTPAGWIAAEAENPAGWTGGSCRYK